MSSVAAAAFRSIQTSLRLAWLCARSACSGGVCCGSEMSLAWRLRLTHVFAAFCCCRSQSGLVSQLDGRSAAVGKGRHKAVWRASARGSGAPFSCAAVQLWLARIAFGFALADLFCHGRSFWHFVVNFVAQWLLNATQPSGVFLPRAAIRDDTAAVFCLFTGTSSQSR